MPYPSFVKVRGVPGGAVASGGFDVRSIDLYRQLSSLMQDWNARFRVMETAIDAMPPGPNKDAAEVLGDDLATHLSTFAPIETIEATFTAIRTLTG